jgi:hypothetical protein
MKSIKALIGVAVMTGALLALPVLPAGAVTAGHAATRSAAVIPIPLTPGAHTVSFQVPTAQGNQASPADTTIGPRYRATVHPRVSCADGSGRTGGFDGELGWGGNGSEAFPAYIDVDGRLWSSCNGTVYLYLSYTNFGSSHNPLIGTAGAGKNVGVHWSTESHWAPYGNIALDVCARSNGWRCGAPVHV